MAVYKLSKKDFTAWVAETTVAYADIGIYDTTSKFARRLRFMAKLGGGYRVDLGNKVVYDGEDIDAAIAAYNNLSG